MPASAPATRNGQKLMPEPAIRGYHVPAGTPMYPQPPPCGGVARARRRGGDTRAGTMGAVARDQGGARDLGVGDGARRKVARQRHARREGGWRCARWELF